MPNMFAVVADSPGGPDVIKFTKQHPIPHPAKKELRIRIAAAGINPIDCHRRAGYGHRMMKLLGAAEFPLILGNDFSGVVEAVGPGVSGWQQGDRVFGCKAASRAGTHAEFAVVPASQVLRLPESLSMTEAAAIPYSFVTAYRLITAGLQWTPADCYNTRVLVHGGLGSVGSIAVRLLKHWGASVVISDRSTLADGSTSIGDSAIFDPSASPSYAPAGRYDAILNCACFEGEEKLFPLLMTEGRFATIVHPLIANIDRHGWIKGGLLARAQWRTQAKKLKSHGGSSYRWVLFRPDEAALQELDAVVKQGLLKPEISRIYDVADATAAHRQMASGTRGKILLQMA